MISRIIAVHMYSFGFPILERPLQITADLSMLQLISQCSIGGDKSTLRPQPPYGRRVDLSPPMVKKTTTRLSMLAIVNLTYSQLSAVPSIIRLIASLLSSMRWINSPEFCALGEQLTKNAGITRSFDSR